MKRAAISALKCLAFLGVWALFLSAVVTPAILIGGDAWFADRAWRLFVESGSAAATLGALIFMALVIDKRRLATIGFSPAAAVFPGLVGGALLGAAILSAPLAVLVAQGAARVAPQWTGFTVEALGFGLVLCFFNVITQEVLVRGYLFQELGEKFGVWTASIATTIFFLALHTPALMDGVQGLIAGANIALASAMMSVALVRTRTLWLPIGIHFGWNGLQGPVLGINVTGTSIGIGGWHVFEFSGDPLLTGGAMGVEGGLSGLIGPALGLIVVLMWPRRVSPG